VLLVDTGRQRNRCSLAMHGYLTRDGIPPQDFLGYARQELTVYETVTLRSVAATGAEQVTDGFLVTFSDGTTAEAPTLLVATGVVDELPDIEGIGEFYGRSVHHCPYCDGWEHRDEPIAVYGHGEHAANYALGMMQWSRDVVLCTGGPAQLPADARASLDRWGIPVHEEAIVRLEGADGRLERIILKHGAPLERTALFFCTDQRQGSSFAAHFGTQFTREGAVKTGKAERTSIPGFYVAGDASKDAQLVIVAAAEGAEAAIAINTELTRRDLAIGPRAGEAAATER